MNGKLIQHTLRRLLSLVLIQNFVKVLLVASIWYICFQKLTVKLTAVEHQASLWRFAFFDTHFLRPYKLLTPCQVAYNFVITISIPNQNDPNLNVHTNGLQEPCCHLLRTTTIKWEPSTQSVPDRTPYPILTLNTHERLTGPWLGLL